MLDKTVDGITSDFFVTHWMPLPEGPNEPTEQGNGRVVELEEGPRLMSNIVECEQTPEALELDMPLEVTFEKLNDDITLPQFKPAK